MTSATSHHFGEQFLKNVQKFLINPPFLPKRNRNNNNEGAKSNSNSGGKDIILLNMKQRTQLLEHTEKLMDNVAQALSDNKIWKKVNQQDGVSVWKTEVDIKTYPKGSKDPNSDSVTIRSEAIIDFPPHEVFSLFQNDDRVSEYNENCQQLQDLARLGDGAKINWSATGRFGPFSARDFITLVTYKEIGRNASEGYLSVASSIETIRDSTASAATVGTKNNINFLNDCAALAERPGYVRSQIELAATFMKPVKGDPNKTKFIQIMQVGSLGGVADSAIAKRIKSSLEVQAPVEFVKKFNTALGRSPPGINRKVT
eukprot:CAMPEP_0178968576 /NCGR_PEP_ID=MMETSP0789-20121207/18348_1 /TAXON_ID=3005 /ORGANISM="Rhizosolenia setigera, Strain CCMP 1694" /LENGTH=313 /DNA_ID=CAMNT_0020654555 /DNA_START=315 /DNA_END=1256 /DNA_ORIENTATION=+